MYSPNNIHISPESELALCCEELETKVRKERISTLAGIAGLAVYFKFGIGFGIIACVPGVYYTMFSTKTILEGRIEGLQDRIVLNSMPITELPEFPVIDDPGK